MNGIITQSPRVEIIQDDFDDYSAFPAINNSALRLFDAARGGAPAKAKFYMQRKHTSDDDAGDEEEMDAEKVTEALTFGKLYHSYVLDRPNFEMMAVILDDARKNYLLEQAKKAGSKARGFSKNLGPYQSWKKEVESKGRCIVDEKRLKTLEWMEKGLRRESEIVEALDAPGRTEVSLYWGLPLIPRDPDCKDFIQCKARLDKLPNEGPWVDDLKSVRSANAEDFARQIASLGFDLQGAWYIKACHSVGLREKRGFRFIAQEKEPPYLGAIYELPESWLRFATLEINATFQNMRNALQGDEWGGHISGEIMPPPYLENIIESGG